VRRVFNPLKPHEIVQALGRVLRNAADSGGPVDEYQRSQLLSAYSIARHLAAEEAGRVELLEWFRAEVTSVLDGDDPSIVAARERIGAAPDGAEVGEALMDLLASLPPSDVGLRQRLRALFVEMADREVEALARASSY
jgi:hypothetical protein